MALAQDPPRVCVKRHGFERHGLGNLSWYGGIQVEPSAMESSPVDRDPFGEAAMENHNRQENITSVCLGCERGTVGRCLE